MKPFNDLPPGEECPECLQPLARDVKTDVNVFVDFQVSFWVSGRMKIPPGEVPEIKRLIATDQVEAVNRLWKTNEGLHIIHRAEKEAESGTVESFEPILPFFNEKMGENSE